MAFSMGNGVSSSVSNIDDKKSLFLLRKIMTLDMLGCKAPNDNELNSTVENLIDRYLKAPDQDSDDVKKELQGLTLVRPGLGNYSVKEIFHVALSQLTGVKLDGVQEKRLNRIYMEQFLTWIQKEIKDLPKASYPLLLNIYYSFSNLAVDLDTDLWQTFFSLEWSASQKKSLNQFKSKYESLRFCALKTPLLKINTSVLFIEDTRDGIESTRDIKKMRGLYISWRTLLEMIAPYLGKDQKKYIVKCLNRSKKLIREGNAISDEEFIKNAKDMIPGILSNIEGIREEYRAEIFANSISFFSEVCKLCSNYSTDCSEDRGDQAEQGIQTILDDHLQESLKRSDEEIWERQKIKEELESALQKIQATIDKIPLMREKDEETLSPIRKEKTLTMSLSLEENKQTISFLIEQEERFLETISRTHKELINMHEKSINCLKRKKHLIDEKKVQCFKRFMEVKILDLILKERSLSSIIFLSQELAHLLSREDLLINGLETLKRLAYDMAEERKGCSKKHVIPSKKSSVKTRSVVEDLSTDSENISVEDLEEESSISSFSTSSDSILEDVDPFNEINRYLTKLKKGKNIQLNGVLSQTVGSFLQTLKAHLLRIKTPADLKDQCDLQTREIFDHLLLGTAGLELLVQAVCDQRTDHIALGFRTALLHCYYAMEQNLSQRIILETNKIDKTDQEHNLLYLAEKAKIADIKRWKRFLQEMTLHLTFSYPDESRLFFQQKQEQKAFSLLDDLSSPNLDNKKIKEALEFCFEMYSKSITFITEISSAQIENQPKLLSVIQGVKEQIIRTLHEPSVKKILLAQSVAQLKELDPTLVKIQQILPVLDLFLKDLDPLNPRVGERDQKIYAAMGTVQSYLKLMETSLEIPQNSTQHSLQKFIKLETIANVDKLFKHLFTAVILLENGEDKHLHTLTYLFTSAADFYKRNDRHAIFPHLESINLGISHHYLHIAKNHSKLHSIYQESLAQAYSLLNVSDEYTSKKTRKSAQGLQKNIGKINDLVSRSLDLFMEFLKPSLEEIKKRYPITAVA